MRFGLELALIRIYCNAWGTLLQKMTRDTRNPLMPTFWNTAVHITLTSRIRVHIWVFILRKFSTLYGLIWVYMIINNSGFRPVCILFKSIHLLQARKVKTIYAIPTTFISYLSLFLQACLLLARGIPSFYTSLCIGHQNKIFVVKEIYEFLLWHPFWLPAYTVILAYTHK